MFEIEDFADLVENQISDDFDVFLTIDKDGDMLVKCFF